MHTEKRKRLCSADIRLLILILILALGLHMAYRIINRAETEEGLTLVISWDGAEVERVELPGVELPTDKTGRSEAVSETAGPRYCQMLFTEGGIFFRWYEDASSLPEIPEGISYNMLLISDDGVSMEAADCRDQICVNHIPIRENGENIICLPHKLAVEITGSAEDSALDGMVK